MQTQPILSHADAMIVVNAVRESLEKDRLSAVVAVVDAHGELLALLRTDGARLTSINIAISKAYTAAREQTPSKVIGQRSRDEGFPMTNFGGFGYVTWGGGLPISVDGQVVGAVGVSGLAENEDIEQAEIGIAALMQHLRK